MHVLISGPNVGRHCSKKISPLSRSGKYCATHTEAKEGQHSKPAPEVSKTSSVIDRAGMLAIKTMAGYLVNPQTRLVFDREHMAIGKEVEGRVVPLDRDDIAFCQQQLIPHSNPEPGE
jgi:hypothetical protein